MISKPKIAFVDDEHRVLDGLRRQLRPYREQWEMLFFDDPLDALNAFMGEPPNVAVLDIRMPGVSGTELAKTITKKGLDTVCIILSGSKDFDVAVTSINDGNIFRYYVKPCEIDALVAGIDDALASRSRRADDAVRLPDQQTKNQNRISEVALDLIPYGVIVSSGDGHALFTNAKAGVTLKRADGLMLDQAGICRATTQSTTQRLHQAMAEARDNGDTTALSLEAKNGEILRVTVQPYQGDQTAGNRLICLFVFEENNSGSPDPKLLMSMFELTIAESRLAAALVSGLSLDEAAVECGITKSSARTYLKKVFSKVGVSRQSELVRTVLVSIASL